MRYDAQNDLSDNEIVDAVRKIVKCYSWHNYNPRGEYVNICFTFKGVNTYKEIEKTLRENRVPRIEIK